MRAWFCYVREHKKLQPCWLGRGPGISELALPLDCLLLFLLVVVVVVLGGKELILVG